MATRQMNFKLASIDKIQVENGLKRQAIRDTGIKGLILDVRETGSKSYYVYKKIAGRPERIFIAKTSDLSAEKARKQAQIILGQIALGINPQEEKRKISSPIMFIRVPKIYFLSAECPETMPESETKTFPSLSESRQMPHPLIPSKFGRPLTFISSNEKSAFDLLQA